MEMGFSCEYKVEAIEISMSNRRTIAIKNALVCHTPRVASIEIPLVARKYVEKLK